MNRSVGYGIGVCILVIGLFLLARSRSSSPAAPAPNPSVTAASSLPPPTPSAGDCDRVCERGRINAVIRGCVDHPMIRCGEGAVAALGAFERGQCEAAKIWLARIDVLVTAAPQVDQNLATEVLVAKLGLASCIEGSPVPAASR